MGDHISNINHLPALGGRKHNHIKKMTEKAIIERENKQLKTQQIESVRLLKQCSTQVGMMLGEAIQEHIATLTGGHFNAKEYHYEKPVGEQ